jgi:hypothetical protein
LGAEPPRLQLHMPDQTAKSRSRFDWGYSFYAAVGAVVSFIAVACIGDLLGLLHLLIFVPIVSIVLLVCAVVVAFKSRAEGASIFVAVVVYAALSLFLYYNVFTLRTTARWLFGSHFYKARVLAQPTPSDGLLKHIEWDGWGFVGIETDAYLVFDPTDSLSTAANSHAPGKYPGLPCHVHRVRRMESHYYVVLFYTEQFWDSCE